MDKTDEVEDMKGTTFFCNICGVTLKLRSKERHENSKKHVKNVEKSSKLGAVK